MQNVEYFNTIVCGIKICHSVNRVNEEYAKLIPTVCYKAKPVDENINDLFPSFLVSINKIK
jgi:hypothetical protein